MAQNPGVPSIVREVVEEMINQTREVAPYLFEDFGFNYEKIAWRPAPFLFAQENKGMKKIAEEAGHKKVVLISSDTKLKQFLDKEVIERAIQERNEAEISMLKHIHFDFLFPISIAGFHQVTRQRTWHLAVESIHEAVLKGDSRMVVPPSIANSSFSYGFIHQYREMMDLLKDSPLTEAIGLVPHAFKIYVLAHIDGWNAIHSIGKRTCIEAQWEIRNIAWNMAKIIKKEFPALGKWVEPQCITYGECPEQEDCGYYKKKKKLL
jgi:thymidylate synthase (FAD)